MKRNGLSLLLVICILFSNIAKAQIKYQSARFKNGDTTLNKFLNKTFAEAAKKHIWPTCTVSVVFSKFNVDSVGNVKNLHFSDLKGTPSVLLDMLKSTILATNGHWIPCKINNKNADSKEYVLPLIYELEAGCAITDSTGKLSYKPLPNNLATSLLYILKFDDNGSKDIDEMDCVLLKPLHIFSAN